MATLHETVRRLARNETPPPGDAAFDAAAAADLLLLYVYHARRLSDPPQALADTEEISRAAQLRSMENKRVLFVIKRALDGAAVRWIVVKGPVIAARFYPAEWTRQYNDIDIVVHPDDLGIALDALVSAGITMLDQNWEMIARKRQGEISLLCSSALIDLHWHFYSSPSIRRRCHVDMRAIIDRRHNMSAAGLSVPIMDDLDGLVFLATHAILSGGHKARWMVDFAFAYASIDPEPARLFERARSHDAALQLAVMVQRVEGSLEVDLCRAEEFLTLSEKLWLAACWMTGRLAPVENELAGTLSGRAVLSATRDRFWSSLTAAARNVLEADRTRRGRRSGREADLAALHSPGGSSADRELWLRTAVAEGGGPVPG
ncbi:MAG: nucleotidyltransferase family protein [Gordonia polyisoprenivorans]|nr:nucleotidyltransferase family protein [Gordonia polyisoprenivorans]